MVIVPSSAVETMGLGGLAGLTALGRLEGKKCVRVILAGTLRSPEPPRPTADS
jgi:hypothetical protein